MSVTSPDTLAQASQALERGDLAGAERIAQGLAAQGKNPQASFLLGKVLARQRRDEEAVRAFGEALQAEPGMAEAWYAIGEVQHRLGDFAAAQISFRKLLALQPGHLLGKLSLGLALKEGGEVSQAESLFAEGLAATSDALMKPAFAYNLALAQFDQGRNDAALANFALVSKLDPGRGAGELAQASVLEDMQRPDEAARLLEDLLRRAPLNEAAHAAYNNLLYRQGRDSDFLKSYDRAPVAAPLQLGKAFFLLKTGRIEEARALYAAVAAREPDNLNAVLGAAASSGQLGRFGEAFTVLERALGRHARNVPLLHQLAVTALEAGEAERAAAAAQKALTLAPLDQYGLALQGSAWRMQGDERDESLNGYDALIGVFDLEAPDGFSTMAEFNAQLRAWLDQHHSEIRAPLNQTLRGGSQTRGHLFNGGHRLVEKLKARIAAAVEDYIAGLAPDARHPFRGRRGNGFRFTGSWSSRLGDCGFHVNHVHPEGWISSCYYVGVPQAVQDETEKQGWIKFGEPSFRIGLTPRRAIQPVPGRLVLFPSYMWHGTIPFRDASPRTTIAFDAVPRK